MLTDVRRQAQEPEGGLERAAIGTERSGCETRHHPDDLPAVCLEVSLSPSSLSHQHTHTHTQNTHTHTHTHHVSRGTDQIGAAAFKVRMETDGSQLDRLYKLGYV
jgi:hypothetical protein